MHRVECGFREGEASSRLEEKGPSKPGSAVQLVPLEVFFAPLLAFGRKKVFKGKDTPSSPMPFFLPNSSKMVCLTCCGA